MSNFDIDSKFNPDVNYSLEKLCKEIISDFHEEDLYDSKQIYRRLKNSSKNGIIDRLKKHINYDVVKNAQNNCKYKFEMLQLLKILYSMEFLGSIPSSDVKSDKDTIPIINLLKKPSLENVETIFSSDSIYGKYTNELIKIFFKNIDQKFSRGKAIQKINDKWQNFITDIIFRYSYDDKPLGNPKEYLDIMKNLNDFLENNIMPTIKIFSKDIKYKEGVLSSFLNILLLHYYECYDSDILSLQDFSIEENINIDYFDAFKVLEYKVFNVKIIDELIDYINNRTNDDFFETILYMINYCQKNMIRRNYYIR